jgi:hypothetical protein
MKLEHIIVLWNCNKFDDDRMHPNGIVEVIEKGAYRREKHDKYMNSAGSCFAHWKFATDAQRMLELLAYLTTMVANDLLKYSVVHNEFLKIEEYREFCNDPQIWIAKNK